MEEAAQNEAPESAPTLGATLAQAREAQDLSRNDVAQRLHMSATQVEALEADDYARLPKGTFLRGFVRNYAKLVGLDPESVLPLLAGTAPAHPVPGIVVPSQNIRFDPLGQRLSSPWVKAGVTAGVVVALGFAVMYWWLYMRGEPPPQHVAQAPSQPATPGPAKQAEAPPVLSPTESMPSPAASVPSSASEPGPSATSRDVSPSASSPSSASPQPGSNAKGTPASAAPAPASSSAPAVAKGASSAPSTSQPANAASVQPKSSPTATAAPAANASSSAAPAKGERRLRFRFKGESWVEVRDASGHVVFRQLNPAGSEASVNARPPLQVVVGNASEVELERDGQRFGFEPLPDTDVARFKVD